MYFRFHQLFKAKLGLLGDEEEDGYLIAFLLKASLWKWDGCSLWKTFLHSSSLSAKSIPSHCLFTGCVQIGFYLRPPNLIWFVSPDDGGHSVRLHHDLQAAQWSFSWAASQQQLHTGGAREYNKRWMWISILVVYKTVLLYQHEFCRSIMILRDPFMILTFMFCVRCGPLKTYRPTSSSLIGSTCTCCGSEGKQKKYEFGLVNQGSRKGALWSFG